MGKLENVISGNIFIVIRNVMKNIFNNSKVYLINDIYLKHLINFMIIQYTRIS